ncbi:MAG: lamin tail domain-containing protein, partial [Sedimentisphaerales bacterium]|nr:lamin tail domain-containing protein [Sedimentisphaerales bacterium]
IAGEFSGRLDDGGERLTLVDAAGTVIQSVAYGDGWYDLSDGEGFSLTARGEALQGATLPQGGRVGLWQLDETAGTTAYDSWGPQHGTLVHTEASTSLSGRYGQAVFLDGQDDYVSLPAVLSLGPDQPFSFFAWVRLDQRSSEQFQVLFQQEGETGRVLLCRDEDDYLATNLGGRWFPSEVRVFDRLGQWIHVGLLYDGQGTVKLYADGRKVGQKSSVVPEEASGGFRVGGHKNDAFYWHGAVDQVCLYRRALTGEEVDALYNPWQEKSSWRLSAARLGSPGTDDTGQVPEPGAVVINEVFSHSHGTNPDWIELHNTTDVPIPIGGWFLSDSDRGDPNRMKYQIPAGTEIPKGGYVLFNEQDHFGNPAAPGCHTPFAFSEGGETVYLRSGQGGQLTGYVDQESFGAAETDVAFGRYEKSTGTYNFVAMAGNTPGYANTGPKRGAVAITEIMYNPGTPPQDPDLEYIEIKNVSGGVFAFQNLADTATGPGSYVLEFVPWQMTDGIEFTFPMDVELAADEVVLLVRDEAAFRAHYTEVPAGTKIFQWDSGNLDNGGEKIELSMAGDQEWQQDRYYIRVEQISYDDEALWPVGADRTGKSLTRIDPTAYGNDPVNWQAAEPSPGR